MAPPYNGFNVHILQTTKATSIKLAEKKSSSISSKTVKIGEIRC